jgi:hypothetical protein
MLTRRHHPDHHHYMRHNYTGEESRTKKELKKKELCTQTQKYYRATETIDALSENDA